MSKDKQTKINLLLQKWPKGTVATNSWLAENGVNNSLKKRYVKTGWLQPIGAGAVIRAGDQIDWQGGLFAVQTQLHYPVHVGGKTALELQGFGHYIRFKEGQVYLYAPRKCNLPKWFLDYNWAAQIQLINSNFLSSKNGTTEKAFGEFSLTLSSPERAILELLYLVPSQQGFEESLFLMENLIGLRPSHVQKLLEGCTSIKVKRLFLLLAEHVNHVWFQRLDLSQINLGTGKRSLIERGQLNAKYQITVPRGFLENETN